MTINITPWTPELIPDPLPPNIDPPLVEPVYRKNGEVIRTTQERRHEAVCLDPRCPMAWEGNPAFPAASAHTSETGHLTRCYYVTEYTLQINPNHPKHQGRVVHTLLPSAPADLPQHKLARLEDTEGREPATGAALHDKAVRGAARRKRAKEVSEAARTLVNSRRAAGK